MGSAYEVSLDLKIITINSDRDQTIEGYAFEIFGIDLASFKVKIKLNKF